MEIYDYYLEMYDSFLCEYPLPKYPYLKHLRTKDFGCKLDFYSLSKDGELFTDNTQCETCGYTGEGYKLYHNGLVKAYAFFYLDENFEETASYKQGEVNYCIRYEFSFEFARGKLLSVEDRSYVEMTKWSQEHDRFMPEGRITVEEFMELAKDKIRNED